MRRRDFLFGLGATAVVAPVVFDMAGSWKRHDDLYLRVPQSFNDEVFSMRDITPFLKEYYNDRTVASLTYNNRYFKGRLR